MGMASPVRVIGSIFRVRRDLVIPIKNHVIAGSGLTLEEVDLLIDLYGAKDLHWNDPSADVEGYVTFAALKQSLVHSQALLSRRIAALEKMGLLETKKTKEIAKESSRAIDSKSKSTRITVKGVELIKPVFNKHKEFCEELLKDMSHIDQLKLLQLNEALMNKLRWKK